MGARPRLDLIPALLFLLAVAAMWWVDAQDDDADTQVTGPTTTVGREPATTTLPPEAGTTAPPPPLPLEQPDPTSRTTIATALTTIPPVATLPVVTQPPPPRATPTTRPAPAGPVLLAAGDIASCQSDGDEATAALLDQLPGTVATLGDNVYERGTAAEFQRCYGPTWGRHRARTRPSAGNHDYATDDGAGYYGYFGAAAGDPAKGYYSYDLGTWHVVVLNSNCAVVSCAAGGEQERWLREDLGASRAVCTVAYWHHARFSSGRHGSNEAVAPLFSALWELGADVVLAGHDHHYERFAPLGPDGRPDPARGVRAFVVGTGGRSHYPVGSPLPGSEVRDDETFGVLALVLREGSYEWVFVPVPGRNFLDHGKGACH